MGKGNGSFWSVNWMKLNYSFSPNGWQLTAGYHKRLISRHAPDVLSNKSKSQIHKVTLAAFIKFPSKVCWQELF